MFHKITFIFFILDMKTLFLEALTLIHCPFHPSIFCLDLYLTTDTENTIGIKVYDYQQLLSHQAPTFTALYAVACVTVLYVETMW